MRPNKQSALGWRVLLTWSVPTRAFNFGEFINGKAQQPLPEPIVPHEAQFSAFADLCHALCNKLLYLLGLGLGVRELFPFLEPLD